VLDQIAAKYSNVGELLAAEVPLDPAQLHACLGPLGVSR